MLIFFYTTSWPPLTVASSVGCPSRVWAAHAYRRRTITVRQQDVVAYVAFLLFLRLGRRCDTLADFRRGGSYVAVYLNCCDNINTVFYSSGDATREFELSL